MFRTLTGEWFRMADGKDQGAAIPHKGFRNDLELRTWLGTQEKAVSVMIANRSAACALPSVFVDTMPLGMRKFHTTALSVFRAIAVSRFAWVWPNQHPERIVTAAHSAATFARSAAAAADHTAPDSARSAAASAAATAATTGAASVTAAGATAAASAVSTAYSAAFGQVTRDARHFKRFGLPPLQNKSLWFGNVINTRDVALIQRTESDWAELKLTLENRSGENWQVWTEWYDDMLHGRFHPADMPDLAFARITEITDDEWKEGAVVVNAKLKEITKRFEEEFEKSFDGKSVEQSPDKSPIDVSEDRLAVPNMGGEPSASTQLVIIRLQLRSLEDNVGRTLDDLSKDLPNDPDSEPIWEKKKKVLELIASRLRDVSDIIDRSDNSSAIRATKADSKLEVLREDLDEWFNENHRELTDWFIRLPVAAGLIGLLVAAGGSAPVVTPAVLAFVGGKKMVKLYKSMKSGKKDKAQ